MQTTPGTPLQTDYAEYLHLETLLASQHPLSDHPDELHFIIIHQVHELWFRLAIHHLARARDAMLASDSREAVRLLAQVNAVFVNLRQTFEHLYSLPPASFHVFRHLLAPGSGMQSYQFREFEMLAGRRDDRFLKWVRNTLGDPIRWEQIKVRLDEPSVVEAFESLLVANQVPDVAALYQHTAEYPDLDALADALSTLDQIVVAWRHSHVQLIERTIGAGTTGTGGTTHEYLQAMLQVRLFPFLWEARNELSRRVDEAHKQGVL